MRFDPEGLGILGNVNNSSIEELWNGTKRQEWREFHIQGRRNRVPLCAKCEYWGVPIAP